MLPARLAIMLTLGANPYPGPGIWYQRATTIRAFGSPTQATGEIVDDDD
jgi:hypothetical protein